MSVAHTGVTTPAPQLALAEENRTELIMSCVREKRKESRAKQQREQKLVRHNSHHEVK